MFRQVFVQRPFCTAILMQSVMRRTVFGTLAGVLVLVVSVAATEGQIFSLAASSIRALKDSTTSTLFDGDRIHALDVVMPFSVLAAGDIADCKNGGGLDRAARNLRYSLGLKRSKAVPNDGMLDTVRILETYPDAPILALGDLVYKRGEPVGFADCYDRYWGVAKNRTWPTPGNHEYQSPFAYGYFDYWQERAGPDRQGYYALDAGRWLILSLNSEIDASPTSQQGDWIGTMLDAYPDRCIAAFYHKPAYSTVARDNAENAGHLFRQLAEAGVIFVLNGHNHFYERTHPLNGEGVRSDPGTVTFVAGAGGRTTSGGIAPARFSDRVVTSTAGVLKLDFFDEAVSWTYLTGASATVSDSGTLPCR